MQLSRAEFESCYQAGRLKVAFIGMSNIGKSYTAMRLATDYDFSLIQIDKLIWENLGHSDMEAFAQWQGHPYTDGYEAREQQSIALETGATRKAMDNDARNPIIDTTGSVIYTDASVLEALRRDYYVVYIKADSGHIETLMHLYFQQPKPLIWAGYYKKIAGLTETKSIMQCYPNLLQSRAKAYEALADTSLSSTMILNKDITIEDIFNALKPAT